MSISQARSRRKASGSMYTDFRSKKHYECGSNATLTKIGEIKPKIIRNRGGSSKIKLLRTDIMSITDKKGKAVNAKIKNVVENEANRNFIRANILTKGTVVETDKGKARITNRPGQEGTVNGILV